MKEIIELRKKREKHFLNKDGTITAYIYDDDVHYLKNGKYEEIDNTLVDKGNNFENKSNDFRVVFEKNSNDLVKVEKDEFYLKMYLENQEDLKITKNGEKISYKNLKNNIDIHYKMIASKLKEAIILNCKETVPETINFLIETNMTLEVKNGNEIIAKNNNDILFNLEAPFMVDSRGCENHCINYELSKIESKYCLKIILDKEWLTEKDTVFPVTIDPTIKVESNNNIYDTYISSKYPNNTYNNSEILSVGVTSDETTRALIKFDLPTIGTGYDIIEAKVDLSSYTYSNDNSFYINVHEVTSSWDETTATWNNMNNKYNQTLEDTFIIGDNYWVTSGAMFDVTNLVKRWYAGKPNYGIMLKWNKEIYNSLLAPIRFLSKTYDINHSDSKKAKLILRYRNQNGLENYMTYNTQNYSLGKSFVNNLTGNLTTLFNINKTIAGKYPIDLNIVYNTNDVILNSNIGYGLGQRLSLHETIEELAIDNVDYLKYTDGDGTEHYFVKIDDIYYDEDGLNLTATLNGINCYINDKEGNKSTFEKNGTLYYLKTLEDVEGNQVNIFYNAYNRITKIIDANNEEINVTYNSGNIVISSNYLTTTLYYNNNNLLTSITNKFGTISFSYNSNNVISNITDINGLGYSYEYYDMIPYKIKKVVEKGLNNAIGQTLTFEYGYCLTRVHDNNEKYNSYTFNTRGNTICITNLDDEQNLNNAYGKSNTYDTYDSYDGKPNLNVNKLAVESLPIKFTKNLFKTYMSTSCQYNSTGGNYGLGTYEINSSTSLIFSGDSNKDYVFSAYFKNAEEITITYGGETVTIPSNLEYTKYDFTINNSSNSNLIIQLLVANNGTAFMSSCQLEEGVVSNYYNLLENPSFEDGYNNWNISLTDDESSTVLNPEIVTLNGGVKALKLSCGPTISSSIEKTLPISGQKGDLYNLSFWYKNEGIHQEEMYTNVALMNFGYDEHSYIGPGEPDIYDLNVHATEWQFFSQQFVAFDDYEDVYIAIFPNSINNFYITNITLTKDIESDDYGYDYDNGNLLYFRNMGGSSSEFKYDKNNQLIEMFNPMGNSFKYEYDNIKTDRLLKGISPSGISNEIKYDSYGNPIKTIINNVNPDNDVISSKKYFIRSKGTKKYLDVNYSTNLIGLKLNDCVSDYFEALKVGEYYRFKIGKKSLTVSNNTLYLIENNGDESLFKLEKNDNTSYILIPKIDETKALSINNDTFIIIDKDNEDYSQQFYFEDLDTNMFIETTAEYTQDGKYITKIIDSLGNETLYDINQNNGLINKIKDVFGNITEYSYNNKDQVIKIKKGNKEVNYEYNNQNLVCKIIFNDTEYSIIYDDFLNIKSIKINNEIVVDNNYSNLSRNLIYKTYGNGNINYYNYDLYDKLISYVNQENTYQYIYDNNGNVTKINSNNECYNYYFDISKRISKSLYSNKIDLKDFEINYDYDINNSIIKRSYKLKSNQGYVFSKNIDYNFNAENFVTKVEINGSEFNFNYDYLGRLIGENINGYCNVEYRYCNVGKKSSFLLKSMKINNDLYEYEYNGFYDVTKIKLNGNVISEYKYNDKQLSEMIDYKLNKKYKYEYDKSGNILISNEIDINNNIIIKNDTFRYNAKNQLINYNNNQITYDEMGNPTTYNGKNLIWKNGRELSSITENGNSIIYNYDIDGNRISKLIDNIKTEYYLEGNKICIIVNDVIPKS